MPDEAKKRQKAVGGSQLAGYRSVRGPHFGTAPRPALALMPPWTLHRKTHTSTAAKYCI